MKTALYLLIAVGALCFVAAGTSKEPEGAFREVRIQVLDIDGTPAANRHVDLRGLSRGSLSAEKPWVYSTDKSGRLTVRLLKSRTWENPENQPGWGNYALVVEPTPERDAGAVSQIVMNIGTLDDSVYGGDRGEGSWGAPITVTDAGVDLTLEISKGIVVEGVVWDYEDETKPLEGVQVHLFHDLGAETHTGYGGEIFPQYATTDAKGRYRFTHVFPKRLFLGIGSSIHPTLLEGDEGYWLRTKVASGSWVDEPLFGIPVEGERLQVEMAVARKRLFRYEGNVTDEKGKWLPGVDVTFGISLHKEWETFADSHSYLTTKTGSKGDYEILLPTPWVNGMSAKISEEIRADRWDGSYAPGEYNFILKP